MVDHWNLELVEANSWLKLQCSFGWINSVRGVQNARHLLQEESVFPFNLEKALAVELLALEVTPQMRVCGFGDGPFLAKAVGHDVGPADGLQPSVVQTVGAISSPRGYAHGTDVVHVSRRGSITKCRASPPSCPLQHPVRIVRYTPCRPPTRSPSAQRYSGVLLGIPTI